MKFIELITKYDIAGPRYTSYPPLPYWEHAPGQKEWCEHISHCKGGVDLYIHVPYCKTICHYCGCNRVKLSSSHDLDRYIEYVIKEWELYTKNCGQLKINSIHLGGGTPSILTLKQIDRLLGELLKDADKINLRGSVEIDPRTTDKEQLIKFYNYGINRVSFGVQDFDKHVQEKIGRNQPYDEVKRVVETAREVGFSEVNFDLIFGLPGQNINKVQDTFKKVVEIAPETIAYYSFAFVPHFSKNQENIIEDDLIYGVDKWNLLQEGREVLFKAGYKEIGMDHYAKEDSSLYQALKSGKLQRNFMGYVNHQTDAVVGLGVSSISSSEYSFIQNAKDFDLYFDSLEKNELPIIKGHLKTKEDIKIESIIHDIMCRQKLDLNYIDVDEIQDFIDDKLIKIEGNVVYILDGGKPFLRNICMRFDTRLKSKKKDVKFSRTI